MPRAEAPNRKRWETFEYDYLGNITKSNDDAAKRYDRSLGVQIGEPGRPERLSSADGVAIRYDEAGNMTDMTVERPGPCESALPCNQRYVYDWNEIGQLARARRWDYAAVVPAITDTPEWDLHYAYSGGQRVLKSAKTPGEDETHTLEVFSSLRVNRTSYQNGEYTRDPTHETVYLAGGGRVVWGNAGLPMASVGQARLFLRIGDHLGSTSVVIDHATGELVEKVAYSTFGEVDSDYRPARWDSFREDLRFTGKEEDIEVGLTYFGARCLNAKFHRWISPDPLTIHGWGADPKPYAYVGGNAMNAVDPWGLDIQVVAETIIDDVYPEISARLESRISELSYSFDGRGGVKLPFGFAVHQQDLPSHLVNEAPEMLLRAAFELIHSNPTFRSNPLSDAVEGTLLRRVGRAKISVPNRGPRDLTRAGAIAIVAGGMAVGGGVAGELSSAEAVASVLSDGGVGPGPKASLDLAQKIAKEGSGAPWFKTVTLLETEEGPTIVAGGQKDLSSAQKALAQRFGLMVARDAPDLHAEETALAHAMEAGLKPTNGVSTNNVCSSYCAPLVRSLGGWVSGKFYGF